nr:hypothetical protein [Polyangiaceae bacterium]
EKSFQAFGVFSTTFPTAFAMKSNAIWKVVIGLFASTAFLTWVERSRNRAPFEPSTYSATVRKLREAWDGTVIVVWGAMVAGASLAALAVWVAGARKFSLPISGQVRDRILDAWWVVALVPPGVLFGAIFACDAWNWIFRERALTTRSFSRGFEPVEDLFMRVSSDAREGAQASPASASLAVGARLLLGKVWFGRGSLGALVEGDKLTKRGENFAVSVFVLLPLLVLLIPLAVFVICYKVLGLKMALAGAIALPSGVAAYLFLGVLGDLLRTRAAGFIFFGTVAGTILSGAYYPALANQVSPKEVFETFERLHQSGEQLGLLGVGGRTAAYYAGGEPPTFTDSVSAYKWLVAAPAGQRRFLAVNSGELKRLNRSYREQFHINVPVVDGRSGQILLVASSLKDGEKSTNALNRWVLASAPKPHRTLNVNLNDQMRVLGYDLVDAAGRTVSDVMPGKEYHMKTYYQILAPMTQDWQAFIHVDGFQRRHNGDHQPLNGDYPMSLWLKDDIIMDDHKFKLEPNFSTGDYTLYFGFFVGETRLQVKEGPSDGQNRINGGALRVR